LSARAARWAFFAWSVAITLPCALFFWVPALRAVGPGAWPVPLDDVYIHFDFARSLAKGYPSTWIPGNGYSSGGTSLAYPALLAPGWLLGLRGSRLGWWAAALALAAVVDLACSLRAVAGRRAPMLVALPPLLLAVPVLDWSLWSGMEVALLGAAIGRAARALRAVEVAPPSRRIDAQWRAGGWLALLPAVRPEVAPLALALGVAVAHASGSLRAAPALARATGPTVGLLLGQASLNLALTGEAAAAGAVRKLVFTDPYRAPADAALVILQNLARLRAEAFEVALGGPPFHLVPVALAAVALVARRTRRLAWPLAAGGIAALLLVSANTTAPFQNLRYAAPSLLILLVLAWLGADALARRGRVAAGVACVLVAAAIVGPARGMPRQIDHFARASRNIEQQQVEVGRQLRGMTPPPGRVFVGDAGAIPYVSGLPALDGLGLGGFRGLPFARASVHGVPAVIELIERLAPGDRPDTLAVYDGWWPGLVPGMGQRLFSVRIEDNVICGGVEKTVYAADWAQLEAPRPGRAEGVADVLDVADLVDERDHDLQLPGPGAGWVVASARTIAGGAQRWDAGRILPAGRSIAWTVGGEARGSRLVVRSDRAGRFSLAREHQAATTEVLASDVRMEDAAPAWIEHDVELDLGPGDRVRLTAIDGDARIFRVTLAR
jgi:hypothetical protein